MARQRDPLRDPRGQARRPTIIGSDMTELRVLYTDLDGTLLGPGGSLFSLPGGGTTLAAAEALARLHEAGVTLVPVSGRTHAQMQENARVLGARAYIAELGGLIVDRGDGRGAETVLRNYGAYSGEQTPFEAMASSGAAAQLLEHYAGALEPHTPWSSMPREATMLFRGYAPDGPQVLQDAGYDWLDLLDNGVIPRPFEGLDVPEVHAYHLGPKGMSKSSGVAAHRASAGVAIEATAMVGDAPSDLAIAPEVGRVFIVANGRDAVGDAIDGVGNAELTPRALGEGFADAVSTLLDGS